MKTKRLFTTVLSVAASCAVAVGLAACGDDTTTPPADPGNTPETAQGITGDQVTQTVWDQALSADSLKMFTAEVTVETTDTFAENQTGTTKYEYTVEYSKEGSEDGGWKTTMYFKGKETYTGAAVVDDVAEKQIKYYWVHDDRANAEAPELFYYQTTSGIWTKTDNSENVDLGSTEEWRDSLDLTGFAYSDYQYNAESKGYVTSADGTTNVVKIKDGKLRAFIQEQNVSGYQSAMSVLYTMKTQAVQLPGLVEDGNEEETPSGDKNEEKPN